MFHTTTAPAEETDEQRRVREAQEANARKTFVDDLKWVMSSPRGRRFVWWLLSVAGVYRLSFNNSGSVTAFNEGQRNVGLRLQAEITDSCHTDYLRMHAEQRGAAEKEGTQ